MLARACVSGVRRWIDWFGIGTFTFVPPSTTVTIHRHHGVSDAVVADAFNRHVQPIVLQALGFQALHASAAVCGGGVVVLAGHAHSGKSTLAHAMGRAGHPQFADDTVVIDARGARVMAFALPFASRLRDPSRAYFDGAGVSETSSTVAVGSSLPLSAIVLLAQSAKAPADPVIRRLTPAEGLRTTMPHANGFDAVDHDDRRRTLGDYLAIAQAVPILELTYRPDFSRIGALVAAVASAASREAVAVP